MLIGGGTITATGLYQVPASGGPYHVQATSQADPTVSSQAAVTVDTTGISVLPTAVTLNPGATRQSRATVTGGAGNSGVLWAVAGTGGGSIDGNGLYTAGTSAGTDTVSVSSQLNPAFTAATAKVTVNPPPTFTLGLAPGSLSIPQNSSATTQVIVTPLSGLLGTVGITATNPGATAITSAYNAATGLLTVNVPASQATGGPFPLKVLGTYGTIEIPQTLQVYVTAIAAPAVTGLAPAQGPAAGGAVVTLAGSGFTTGSTVHFGAALATGVTVASSSQLTATAPAGSPGVVDVTVTNPSGTSATNASDRFTYVAGPVVTAVTPGYGPASFPTTVVLKGSHFTGALTVLFGDVPAMSFAVVSDSVINATSPGGPAEVVDVTVTGAGGTSTVSAADQFSYLGAPVIFTVSPATGKAGTVVTLTGASFTRAYGISFGDASVLTGNFTVVSDSEITVTAPTNDLPGSVGDVTIAVTTPIGLSNGAKFTYD